MKKTGKRSSVFISLCLIVLSLSAQHTVNGIVIDDSEKNPVPYATVVLLKDSLTMTSGTMTHENGAFILENIPAGKYTLEVSFLGYDKWQQPVHVSEKTNVGNIHLSSGDIRLEEVVVTAQKPLITQKTDRMIVNVSDHISTSGKSMLEVVSQTPGVLVIGSDISALGKSASIYVDGRPTQVSGDQLETLLASMQGDEIDRIEIITNPSSRYDASGGAIIDIKTKKGLQYGLNGAVEAGYRQGRKDRENTGLNLNYRKEKYNLYGNYYLNRSNAWERIEQTNITKMDGVEHTFHQKGEASTTKAQYSHHYKVGMDVFITPQHTIGGFVNGSYSETVFDLDLNSRTTITPSLNDIASSESYSPRAMGYDLIQYNLNYQGKFKQPGQQLNIDLDYVDYLFKNKQNNDNAYFGNDGKQIGTIEKIRNKNLQDMNVWSAKADFIQPIGKGRLETGVKTSKSETDNDLLIEKHNGSVWESDQGRTNRFVYTEWIHAAYANYSHSIGRFDLQAGLRGEYTKWEGDQKATNTMNDTTYTRFFPTAYVNYRLSEMRIVNAGYRKSIARPGYFWLNPFETIIDAFSFERGNPYLKPMLQDNFSLAYNDRKLGLTVNLAYDIRKDVISTVMITDGDRFGNTRVNFGKTRQFTSSVNYHKSLFKWWMMNTLIMGMYIENRNKSVEFGTTNNHSLIAMGQLYNRFSITPTLSAELTALYITSQKREFLKAESMQMVNIGVRKMLLKDKLSLSLQINDLFDTFKEKVTIQTANQYSKMKSDRDKRYVNLSLRYTFGSKAVKEPRHRQSGAEDEIRRAN